MYKKAFIILGAVIVFALVAAPISRIPSGTKLIDQNGAAYGVKHVGNKPRVSSMPYLYDIAEDNVPDHTVRSLLGYNAALPNGVLEDITELSANVILPTTAATGFIDSTSANDAGVASYTATATGGTTTTLVDTGEDFTAGSIVAVGDLVLLDDDVAFGVVTTVAVTTLTCADGFVSDAGAAITPASGDNYRILDKSAGGTGAQVVELHTLSATYAAQSEFVIPNGITAVATTKSAMRYNNLHVMDAGSGGVAAGTIYAQDDAAGTNKYISIGAGGNMSLQAHFTVPLGKTVYIVHWSGYASSTKSVGYCFGLQQIFMEGS